MFMNIFALGIGFFIAVMIIVRFKKTGYEHKPYYYPALLATFPAYYWFFAIYAKDFSALFNEVVVGMLFIAAAWLAYKFSKIKSLLLLALGFIGHGVYDVVHADIYSHSVAPNWWPEFCGSIDILLGVYMLWLVKLNSHQKVIA